MSWVDLETCLTWAQITYQIMSLSSSLAKLVAIMADSWVGEWAQANCMSSLEKTSKWATVREEKKS